MLRNEPSESCTSKKAGWWTTCSGERRIWTAPLRSPFRFVNVERTSMAGLFTLVLLPLYVFGILVPFFLVLGGSEFPARLGSWLTETMGAFGLGSKLAAV